MVGQKGLVGLVRPCCNGLVGLCSNELVGLVGLCCCHGLVGLVGLVGLCCCNGLVDGLLPLCCCGLPGGDSMRLNNTRIETNRNIILVTPAEILS